MDKKGFDNLKRIIDGKDPKRNVQVGYEAKGKQPTTYDKEVGDEWEEHGKKWKMTESGAQSISRMEKYRMPWFCPKCKKVMKGRGNRKAWYSHGTCLDCMVDYHSHLKTEGKLEQYMFHKRLSSAMDYYKEMEANFQEFKEKIDKNPEFVFSDGRIEKWSNQLDTEKLIEEYESYVKDYKEKLDEGRKNYEERFGEKLEEYERPKYE